jgi:hypothetical protein
MVQRYTLVAALLIFCFVIVPGMACPPGGCHDGDQTISPQMSIKSDITMMVEDGSWHTKETYAGLFVDPNLSVNRAYRYSQTGIGDGALQSSTEIQKKNLTTDKTGAFVGLAIVDEEIVAGQDVCNTNAEYLPDPTPDPTPTPGPGNYTLTVYVKEYDSHAVIPNATVTLTPPGGSTLTDSEGITRFPSLGVGTYTVSATKSGYDSASVSIHVDRDQAVTLYLKKSEEPPITGPFNLTVYVKDYDTHAAILNATVNVTPGGETATDSEGMVRYLNLPVGNYQVMASAEEYDSSSLSVYVDRDQAVTLYLRKHSEEPPITGPFNLTVYVKDYDTHAAILNATVNVTPGGETATDSEGMVRYLNLTAGTYQVTASAEEYDSSSLSVYVDRDQAVTLYLKKHSEEPPIGDKYRLVVYVKDYDSLVHIPNATVSLSPPGIRLLTNEDEGAVRYVNLTAGDYQVEANKTGYLGAQSSITITRDQMLVLYLKQLPAPTPTPTPEPTPYPCANGWCPITEGYGVEEHNRFIYEELEYRPNRSFSSTPPATENNTETDMTQSASVQQELGGRYESRGSMSSSGSDSETGNGTIPDTNEPSASENGPTTNSPPDSETDDGNEIDDETETEDDSDSDTETGAEPAGTLTTQTHQSVSAGMTLMGDNGAYRSKNSLTTPGVSAIQLTADQQVLGSSGDPDSKFSGSGKFWFTGIESQESLNGSWSSEYRQNNFLAGNFALQRSIKTPFSGSS